MSKQCLIVVDMQNDFIDGALGFEEAQSVIEPIKEKMMETRKAGGEVIFTLDTHDSAYLQSVEGKHLPVEHCLKGSKGHKLHPQIEALKQKEDKVFEKPTFPALELGNYLKDRQYSSIELCGLVSNICVLSNAVIVKSAQHNTPITVDANATKSFDASLHDQALNIMESLHIEIKNRS